MEEELLTVKDLAKMLRLGQRTIWRRIKDGSLPSPIRIGRVVRFRRPSIEKWLRNLEKAREGGDAKHRSGNGQDDETDACRRHCATEGLLSAMAEDCSELISEALIVSGADVNAADRDGWTPLHFAASRNQVGFAELLIDHGAFLNAQDNEGRTPLQLAELNGHDVMASMLREYGAKQ